MAYHPRNTSEYAKRHAAVGVVTRGEAEYLLSLLACQAPSFDKVIHDTSGAKVTPADVAAALAKESPIVEPVARVKYAAGSIEALSLKYFAQESAPPSGLYRSLLTLAARDCLFPNICPICNGQITEYPEHVTCAGCDRAGKVKLTDNRRLKFLGLKKWGRWRDRYTDICHDLLEADNAAISAMYRHFGGCQEG